MQVGSTDPLAPKRSLCNTFGGCGRSGKRSLCNTFGGCGRLTKRSLCNSPGGCSLSRGTKPSIWDYEDDSAPTGLVQPNARALLESTNRQTMMDYTSDPSDRTGARSVDQQYNQDYNFSPKLKQQLIDYSY